MLETLQEDKTHETQLLIRTRRLTLQIQARLSVLMEQLAKEQRKGISKLTFRCEAIT